MTMNFNGSEYTLVDGLGRPCGWTRDKVKADKVIEAVRGYGDWSDIPKSVRMKLAHWLASAARDDPPH